MIKLLSKLLRSAADKMDSGDCNISEEDIIKSLNILSEYDPDQWLTKDQACGFLHISRSTFDTNVKYGFIPKGRKIKGWKEKVWIKSELMNCKLL